jgi:hypothetical protein
MRRLIGEGNAALQNKLARGEPLNRSDLRFIGQVKTLAAMERMKLQDQYSARLETLEFFGFISGKDNKKAAAPAPGFLKRLFPPKAAPAAAPAPLPSAPDTPAPSFEKIMASFTPEELETASKFQEPALLLIPECSFARKVQAMNGHKTMFMDDPDLSKRQQDCYVDNVYRDPEGASPQITGWRAMIVDGAREMALKPGDDKAKKLKDRLAARKAARKPGEKGMDRHACALLMMEGLRRNAPVDQIGGAGGSYCLLDADPANSASRAPRAYWSSASRRVGFSAFGPDAADDTARFRSGVGGRVLT